MAAKKGHSGKRVARVVAAIELGTTSIRMEVAQVDRRGRVTMLETLQQAVSLGRDAFTTGTIAPETTEDCVRVLSSFRRVLLEYGAHRDEQILAVATSAVREARNRDAFLDRIRIGTGITVRVIDEAEVNRFTYLALAGQLREDKRLKGMDTLIVEVGGGSTEVLILRHGHVGNALAYRLGSLRLRQMFEEESWSLSDQMEIMRNQVNQTVGQIMESLAGAKRVQVLALGGDARLAAGRIVPDWDKKGLMRIRLADLNRMTAKLLKMSVDDIVKRQHLSYPEAETLAPALLFYSTLGKALKSKHIYVGSTTVRDGLLVEMATRGDWSQHFQKQVISSAMEVAERYQVDLKHARRVARVSNQLFVALRNQHRLGPRYELLLTLAALLHEAGTFISNRSHHKHSLYLILHSDIFGMGKRDLTITALVARYHRRALPRSSHDYYEQLDDEAKLTVVKLSAILRLADALSRRSQKYRPGKLDINMDLRAGRMVVGVDKADLTLEQHALHQKGGMFESVYGMTVEIVSSSRRSHRG